VTTDNIENIFLEAARPALAVAGDQAIQAIAAFVARSLSEAGSVTTPQITLFIVAMNDLMTAIARDMAREDGKDDAEFDMILKASQTAFASATAMGLIRKEKADGVHVHGNGETRQ
jgi:hypothetical protein